MPDFKQAVKWMKEGKKVRVGTSCAIHSIEDSDTIKWRHKTEPAVDRYTILASDVQSTDWEIYEEKDNWNLADKLLVRSRVESRIGTYAHKSDIKTFIQKVKEDIDKVIDKYDDTSTRQLNEIIDKRAGDL